MARYYDLEQIKDISIKDVAESIYNLNLKSINDKYLCNIRQERTPSCYIYADNTFYDFGSQAGGSVIDFVSSIDGIDFMESV